MRTRTLLLIVTFSTSALPAAAQTSKPRESKAARDLARIRELDAGWAHAYEVHDTAFAAKLMADDIVITTTDGTLKPKARELADVAETPGLVMAYFRTTEVNARQWGDAAVATGLASWKFTYQGRETSVTRRYTAVYERGGPLGWRMVAIQLGRAP